MRQFFTALLILCGAVAVSGQTPRNEVSISFGSPRFNIENTPRVEFVSYPLGGSGTGKYEYRRLPAKAFQIGFNHAYTQRWSCSLDILGAFKRNSSEYTETNLNIDGESFTVDFPREERLNYKSIQALALFDFVKNDNVQLQFGAGPLFVFSRFQYISRAEYMFTNTVDYILVNLSKTTKKTSGLGAAFCLRFSVDVGQHLALFAGIQHQTIEDLNNLGAYLGMSYAWGRGFR